MSDLNDELNDKMKRYWELPDAELKELQVKVASSMTSRIDQVDRNVVKYAPILQIIGNELSGRHSNKIAEESKNIARYSMWIASVALIVSAVSAIVTTCS